MSNKMLIVWHSETLVWGNGEGEKKLFNIFTRFFMIIRKCQVIKS